jgi:hypothetical protein
VAQLGATSTTATTTHTSATSSKSGETALNFRTTSSNVARANGLITARVTHSQTIEVIYNVLARSANGLTNCISKTITTALSAIAAATTAP